jgi:hypothetical protein
MSVVEIGNSQWDSLFQSSERDSSTTSQTVYEYKEDNVTLLANQTTFKFQTKDLDAFLVPSESYLRLRLQILDGGVNAGANTRGTFVSEIANIFDSAQYKINEKLVCRNDKCGQTALVKHLVYDDPSWLASNGQMEFFYKEVEADGACDNTANNTGFIKRYTRTNRGEVECVIAMKSLFGYLEEKSAIRGVRHSIEFTKTSDLGVCLHRGGVAGGGGAQVDLTFSILDASWFVPAVKPSIDTLAMVEKELASGSVAKKLFADWTTHRSGLYQQAENSPVWRITTQSSKPIMIAACFKLAQRVSTQRMNYARFDNLRCTQLELRINSKVIPEQSYDINFATERYSRQYFDMLLASGRNTNEEGSPISYEEFRQLYPLFVFDLSSQDEIFRNVKSTDIEIRARVDPATYIASLPAIADTHAANLVVSGNYYIEAVIVSEREATIEGKSGRVAVQL